MKVYFNGSCNICNAEINHYKKKTCDINYVDISKNKKILICSFLNNKKYIRMLSNLSTHFAKIIVVKMNEENSITEDLLPENLKLYFANSLIESFKTINKYSSKQTSIYFGGSLYFIGEVIKFNRLKIKYSP